MAEKVEDSEGQVDTIRGDSKPGRASAIGALVSRAKKLKVVRVFLHYLAMRGPIMAAGLSYQAIFAVFAALWVSFAIAGLIIRNNPELLGALIDAVAGAVPGLIDNGDGTGAIDPRLLLQTGVLGWTGSIALVGLIGTALGWLASARIAIRAIFTLGDVVANFVLLKAKDLGLALVFGVALIVSAALSALSTALLGFALDQVGRRIELVEVIGSDSVVATVLGRITGLLVVLALDTFVLASLYRVLSGIPIPFRRLLGGSLIGGVALGTLKVLGAALLGGASRNPLLASFAVIIGLLIWFNLVCQVILICAAWIAVGMQDNGIPADPEAEAERLERERLARQAEEEARRPRGLARLFRRRRKVGATK